MHHAAHFSAQRFGEAKPVNEHQNDDGGNCHAYHADAEYGLGNGFVAGEFFKRTSELKCIAADEHRGELAILMVGRFRHAKVRLDAGLIFLVCSLQACGLFRCRVCVQ